MPEDRSHKRRILLVVGVLFHLLYLWSIFDIYFVSPLVHGMNHFVSTNNPPAKRLFLIVGDGQRADKTLAKIHNPETGKSEYLAPYLRSLIETQGTYGISHTRMPTESRPGHVAMIAGFYEDVSAVTKGWKENPVDFDSVFNQSAHTYSFGSPDILPMFAAGASDPGRVDTWMYGHEFEDFTSSSIELDKFVFEHLDQLFDNSTKDPVLDAQIRQDKNVFFLHLLGTDTAGHSYRPYSKEYYDNIRYTDEQIRKLVPKVNSFFGDDRTAFVFTADHGMSDFGSHGDGHPDNTRTPLICWGAGCKKPLFIDASENEYLAKEPLEMETWGLDNIKRHDVKQADIASLMSFLVGLNYPANSVGELPIEYLDVPELDKIRGLYHNALSIHEQYLVKLQEVESNQFDFKPFPGFETKPGHVYKAEIENLIEQVSEGVIEAEKPAIELIEELITVSLQGLDYLQKYNWLLLRSIVTLGFVGWIVYSFIIFLQLYIVPSHLDHTIHNSAGWIERISIYTFFGSLAAGLGYVLFYQNSPINYYLYTAFPIYFWHSIVEQRQTLIVGLREFFKGYNRWFIVVVLGAIVGYFECITIGFTNRGIFVFMFVVLGVYPMAVARLPLLRSLAWVTTCGILSFFPAQNPVKTETLELIVAGGVLILLIGAAALYQLRLPSYTANLVLVQLGLVALAIVSTSKAVVSLQRREGLPKDAQVLGWLNLGLSLLVLPVLHQLRPDPSYKTRFLIIFLAFSPTFVILTISFETLFYVLFSAMVFQWIGVESAISSRVSKWPQLLRVAIIGFFFLQIAFFGTGNIASVSTFSLDSVYRLLPIFDPFPMGALLMLKLIIPYVILSVGLGLMNLKLHLIIFSISSLIISLSDLLSLNFFYLVKTEGSWLDIGLTISNYCLAILNSLFILLLELLSNILLAKTELVKSGHHTTERSKIDLAIDSPEYRSILREVERVESLGGSIATRVKRRSTKT
ncbi:GPI ethanolamine phosphate transferase 1 [Ogataea parapolymorpha DL-1]|uniref:GPI ethanolamine phosphate transferase 1 n=1 Tax=Ogataea parapolymorpha (strain ATCC 26012 / BCRC 20466 / JCM 22074 / NRRL Y-7560 / DL-1) TaxID=871575 RepID=W1Q913_OGAPD|nr:GPI ethanolamine phosphate transferase 1 [Ogataea parapolymorpha DL-1]ESW96542.1 GPI ethanolamine phosphate transferase 1 [Ogataea parapolymorpha DL-1]